MHYGGEGFYRRVCFQFSLPACTENSHSSIKSVFSRVVHNILLCIYELAFCVVMSSRLWASVCLYMSFICKKLVLALSEPTLASLSLQYLFSKIVRTQKTIFYTIQEPKKSSLFHHHDLTSQYVSFYGLHFSDRENQVQPLRSSRLGFLV